MIWERTSPATRLKTKRMYPSSIRLKLECMVSGKTPRHIIMRYIGILIVGLEVGRRRTGRVSTVVPPTLELVSCVERLDLF